MSDDGWTNKAVQGDPQGYLKWQEEQKTKDEEQRRGAEERADYEQFRSMFIERGGQPCRRSRDVPKVSQRHGTQGGHRLRSGHRRTDTQRAHEVSLMAAHSYLRKVASTELTNAMTLLEDLLPENGQAREGLSIAQNDVIGRDLPDFRLAVLAAALASVAAEQERRLAELEEAVSSS